MKFFWLGLFVITSSIQAAESTDLCADSQTQSELNDCAAKEAKAADASLEKFYQAYTKKLTPEQIKLFQSANSEWLRYRDSQCKFESSATIGGSAYPMVFHFCIESQSAIRLQEIRKLSQCKEGFGCPAW